MKKILYILILIATTCFAQAETTPINNAASDSAAYYEQLYQYNLDSYNFDKKAANIALITAGVSTGLAGVSTIAFFLYYLEQHSKNSDYRMSMSHPWVISTLVLCDIQRKKHATSPTLSIHIAPIIDPINQSYGGALALNF